MMCGNLVLMPEWAKRPGTGDEPVSGSDGSRGMPVDAREPGIVPEGLSQRPELGRISGSVERRCSVNFDKAAALTEFETEPLADELAPGVSIALKRAGACGKKKRVYDISTRCGFKPLYERNYDKVDFVKPGLPIGAVGSFAGTGASGKTTHALMEALSIAGGLNGFTPGGVLYLPTAWPCP